MAKKNKVMKNQSRKKSENEKKINPFEVKIKSFIFEFEDCMKRSG